jgi:hypothetical protein
MIPEDLPKINPLKKGALARAFLVGKKGRVRFFSLPAGVGFLFHQEGHEERFHAEPQRAPGVKPTPASHDVKSKTNFACVRRGPSWAGNAFAIHCGCAWKNPFFVSFVSSW